MASSNIGIVYLSLLIRMNFPFEIVTVDIHSGAILSIKWRHSIIVSVE